ncbi:MAG: glycosyltransferase family 2 protein [Cyanobacteria bacterium P01_D01_bin.73]
MFSIYILTYNEETDIADCIESALLSDDVIVVDSFSSDRTIEIANKYPIRVIQHKFESHGKQRTWMLEEVPTKHPWVYVLEADELMTPELFKECSEVIQNTDKVAYFAAERVMFMNSWIKNSTQFPRYQMRLIKKGSAWFSDYGHTEREEIDGEAGYLTETYPHYTSGKGLSRWIDKHNTYSTNEAKETVKQLKGGKIAWKDLLFAETEIARRHALKDLSLRVPFRPLVRFLYMYFGLGGILDGRAGFTWCVLQAFYEYLILLKVWEMKNPMMEKERVTERWNRDNQGALAAIANPDASSNVSVSADSQDPVETAG